MWRVACVCGGLTPDAWECIGFSWAVWERHCPSLSLSLFFLSHLLSNVWSPLMWTCCQYKGSLHLSLFAYWREKGSFTGPCSRTPTHPNLLILISYRQLGLTGSLWESRCLSLMPLHCGLWGHAGGNMCHVPTCLQEPHQNQAALLYTAPRHTHSHSHIGRQACGGAPAQYVLSCQNVQQHIRSNISLVIKLYHTFAVSPATCVFGQIIIMLWYR